MAQPRMAGTGSNLVSVFGGRAIATRSRAMQNMRYRRDGARTARMLGPDEYTISDSVYQPRRQKASPPKARQLRLSYTREKSKRSTFRGMRDVGKTLGGKMAGRMPRLNAGVLKGVATTTMVGVGVLGLTTAAFTRGIKGAMQDSVVGRYLRDQRNTSAINFRGTRVGLSGTRSRTSIGNHVGLSLAMSSTRHGRG